MVDVVTQLCIKSYEITAENGAYFKAHQGKQYTTTVPKEDKKTIVIFSNYWVPAPKEHFVLIE